MFTSVTKKISFHLCFAGNMEERNGSLKVIMKWKKIYMANKSF